MRPHYPGRSLLFATLLFLSLSVSCLNESYQIENNHEGEIRKTKIIAHRGYWDTGGSCENSIAAIENAARIGADGIEFDLWSTKDDSIVVYHDASVSGLTISSTDYSELTHHRLKNGEIIPTLIEYLTCIKSYPDLTLFIELKSPAVAEQLIRVINESGLPNPIVYISFYEKACESMMEGNPSNPVYLLLNQGEAPSAYKLKEKGYDGIAYSVSYFLGNQHLIQDAKDQNLMLATWVVNSVSQYEWFFRNGFGYAITDNPAALIEESLKHAKYWK